MRAHSRAYRRFFSLIAASALGCGTVVGAGATPAAAAVGSPTALTTSGQACAAEAPGPYLSPVRLNDANAVVLQGSYSGAPEGAELVADFQVWDVTKPDEPQQWRDGTDEENNRVYIQLEDPSRQLDGVTYAWRVRVLDGEDASPWSDTCHFTVDRTGGAAPAVASVEYPAGDWDNAGGEIGKAGTFTFTSVSDDTKSYLYRFYSSEAGGDDDYSTVEAASLGGPATVTWTPKGAGGHSVHVYAVDRAGNWSDQRDYNFWVRETRPAIFSSAYPDWGSNLDYNIGVPGAFQFTSNVEETESFAWRIGDDGPSGSVAAEGREATAMIAPAKAGRQTLYVQSVTRDGRKHPARAYEFLVDNGPRVTGDTDRSVIIGSSLTFHFAPRMPDVKEYLYWHRDYDGEHPDQKITVPARADGTADLTWAATNQTEDTQALQVQSRSADGTLSEPRWLSISVSGASPWVTRKGGDALGSTATFTASTEMVNVKEYEVLLNREPESKQVIPAAADGTATFQVTPAKRGYNYVTVVARNAAGVRTSEGGTSWSVSDSPVVSSADFPASGSGKIAPGTFTFKPRQTGATKYEYSLPGSWEQTVTAEADGSATVPWTPTESGYFSLTVRSLTASGAKSLETYYHFYVAPDPLTVTAVSPTSVAKGAVRTITITGSGLSEEYRFTVTPAGGPALTATVQSVTADRRTAVAEVDLTTAAEGKASLTVRPNDWSDAVSLADAFTITGTQALRSVSPPTITGTVAVGATVRASTGEWTPEATAHSYQWAANGTAISGATSATYVIPPAQLGKRLTVTVKATKPEYTSAQATSTATAAIAKGAAPRAVVLPKITGTARVGNTVQASTGTWSPTVDSYRYEWRVGGTLNSTTTRSLKLTAAMRDKAVTVTVFAVKAGYTDGRAVSAAVIVRS
jgi:hypothetical protein